MERERHFSRAKVSRPSHGRADHGVPHEIGSNRGPPGAQCRPGRRHGPMEIRWTEGDLAPATRIGPIQISRIPHLLESV